MSKKRFIRLEKLVAVAADQDVSVAVHLQQVSVKGVEPEAANGERIIVLKVLRKFNAKLD